jgi:hypothetical protein
MFEDNLKYKIMLTLKDITNNTMSIFNLTDKLL